MIKILKAGDKVLYQEKIKGWRNRPHIATVIHAPLPTDQVFNIAIIEYTDVDGKVFTRRANISLLKKVKL